MQETVRDVGLVPGSGRSPGGGTDNPLQYSCLEIPMDRVDWWALVHRVAMNQIRLKQLSNGSIKGEKKMYFPCGIRFCFGNSYNSTHISWAKYSEHH